MGLVFPKTAPNETRTVATAKSALRKLLFKKFINNKNDKYRVKIIKNSDFFCKFLLGFQTSALNVPITKTK